MNSASDKNRDWLRPALSVEVSNVSLSFDDHQILHNLHLSINKGSLVCLLGPSGSGKSTILRLIAGLERPDTGSVSINGKLMCDEKKHVPAEARQLGYMFQDFALFPHLNVGQNIAFGLRKLNKKDKAARVHEVLEQVGLTDKINLMPHALSGGQQQRVALARALAPKPDLLLLDEPFSGLEQSLRAQMRDDFLHLIKATGTTAIMVTHDPEEAMFMADSIAVIRNGSIEQVGKPDDLYFQPASAFVAGFFGEINYLQGTVEEGWVKSELGNISRSNLPDGTNVHVYIRPDGLKLCPLNGLYADLPMAEVEASRMIGTSSLVHMCLLQRQESRVEIGENDTHLHARIQGGFLPRPGERFGIGVNPELAYAFVDETDQPLRL
ncbi:MAG: ABC transporter ATP-binding protein [Alphaproteobacteria bacterium]